MSVQLCALHISHLTMAILKKERSGQTDERNLFWEKKVVQ
jgi:hypothetical protein